MNRWKEPGRAVAQPETPPLHQHDHLGASTLVVNLVVTHRTRRRTSICSLFTCFVMSTRDEKLENKLLATTITITMELQPLFWQRLPGGERGRHRLPGGERGQPLFGQRLPVGVRGRLHVRVTLHVKIALNGFWRSCQRGVAWTCCTCHSFVYRQ